MSMVGIMTMMKVIAMRMMIKIVTVLILICFNYFRGAGVNIVRGVAGAGVLTSFDR